jgi:hypothetical protein
MFPEKIFDPFKKIENLDHENKTSLFRKDNDRDLAEVLLYIVRYIRKPLDCTENKKCIKFYDCCDDSYTNKCTLDQVNALDNNIFCSCLRRWIFI